MNTQKLAQGIEDLQLSAQKSLLSNPRSILAADILLIRELKPSDFSDLVEVFFSFFPEAEADPSFGLLLYKERPTMEDERKWFESTLKGIAEGNIVIAVAEAGSHVVGWCDVRRLAPKTPVDHRGVLGICVKKEFRGRGIGEALIGGVVERCKGKFEIVELTVFSGNKMAIRLYERFGFKKYGSRRNAVKRAGRYFDEDLMDLKI
jgi:RimJ/RimL family protein N-acetyltransferase